MDFTNKAYNYSYEKLTENFENPSGVTVLQALEVIHVLIQEEVDELEIPRETFTSRIEPFLDSMSSLFQLMKESVPRKQTVVQNEPAAVNSRNAIPLVQVPPC